MRIVATTVIGYLLVLIVILNGSAQTVSERDIANRYAPIFHQALGDKPRGDYITNFNFDGDWNGTNNWANAENKAYKLNAYVYYSVAETATHYFLTYAVFHARDYKGGEKKGVLISEILRRGAEIAADSGKSGTILDDAALAHENDMEGALVVVDKAVLKVAFVETLHHNKFGRYVAAEAVSKPVEQPPVAALDRVASGLLPRYNGNFDGVLAMSGDHPELYIEPKGHGIEAWGSEQEKPEKGFLIYKYSGRAEDPEAARSGEVNYDLLPIATTLWPRSRTAAKNVTFAAFKNYGTLTIDVLIGGKPGKKKVVLGQLASAFDGKIGGINMARPPWGWCSSDHRDDPPGLWFFDPARVVKRDFGLSDTFSTVYVKVPFWAGKH